MATVREVTESRSGKLYFHFTDGQVWRLNEVRRSRYSNDQKFEATINKGMMGDYRMRIGDNGRMVRIRRVQ